MMDWGEVDRALLRESIKMAKPVRDSIEAQVNIGKIISQFRSAYPETARPTTIETREWANSNIAVNNTELNKGLGILYAIGWMFGRDIATSAYAHERLNKAAPTDEQLNGLLNIDWANWKPGNNSGALLASPPGGLKRLLKRRGLDLKGLTDTLLNRIGTQLANALTSGATDTVLGKALEAIVGDPERALTIANTSMASAMSVSTLETYKEFDLAKMRWLALEPCETCAGNGALGPVNVGEAAFKNVQGDNITEPPAHPNCRCALAPVIDLDQFKSVNQPRDERGRWTSGGTFVPGKWNPTDKAVLVSEAVDKYAKTHMHEDGSPLTKEELDKYKKKSQRYYNSVTVYENGPVKVTIPKDFDTAHQATTTAEILKNVDSLQTAHPLPYVELIIKNQALGGVLGEHQGFTEKLTGKKGSEIRIETFSIQGSEAWQTARESNDPAKIQDRTRMPLDSPGSRLEFTMAHEWGHAVDFMSGNEKSSIVEHKLLNNDDWAKSVSKYGKTGPKEAYSELFAQNYMENKQGIAKLPVTVGLEEELK